MQTIEIAQPPVVDRGSLRLIRRHPLISYFVIAYAFTWTYDLLFLVLFPIPDVAGRSTPRDFGPAVAALVVTAVIAGKSGLRQFFQRFLILAGQRRLVPLRLRRSPVYLPPRHSLDAGSAGVVQGPLAGRAASVSGALLRRDLCWAAV